MLHVPQRASNLLLHCGARKVSREQLHRIAIPSRTPTWCPINHLALIEAVETSLQSAGLIVLNQAHSLSHGGARYFGLTEVQGNGETKDYARVLGLRNSHDKRFPAGIVAGASVFVCDNLSFSGEVRLSRKHTLHLERDLPWLAERAVGKLVDCWQRQDRRIDSYRNYRLGDLIAHDMVVRAVDAGACPNRLIPSVLKEWREPSHQEFQDRSAWSLFNGFTEVLKGNLVELPRRTETLHRLFDAQVGLN